MAASIKLTLKLLIEGNFWVAAALLVFGGLTASSDTLALFAFDDGLYNAPGASLRTMLFFLAVSELLMLAYCAVAGNFRPMVFVGIFLVFITGSLAFYGQVNDIGIDERLPAFFVYTGLSHCLYGLLSLLPADRSA